MKRIVSLILALSMVLSMFTFSFAGESLKDVAGTKYQAAVEALVELGVVDGYPDGTYLPDNVVTRAELAKLLVIAYGLAPAAEAAPSVTPFADANNHWASGYVNVSADYKFVNGYPDGSFLPNGTVTYAEAITMCLRVLGYANEIDSKGTWPTNYIAKAQDLKLMKDIEFKSYNDGATRGNIALLIWNMLRTPMWQIVGESEGDGLESRPNSLMLNVKFSDYEYSKEAVFNGYKIEADKKEDKAVVKVIIACNCDDKDCKVAGTYEYNKNDFFAYVPGTEVEVLVNHEDVEALTIVPTGEDKLVAGTVEALEDEDYELKSNVQSADYIYGIAVGDEVTVARTLNVSSIYVDKVSAKKEGIKINSETIRKDSEWNKKLVLVDGERGSIRDVEAGDIVTTVTVGSNGSNKAACTFYVVGCLEAEGELTKYVVADEKITVGGEKYVVSADTKYVEDPSKSPVVAEGFVGTSDTIFNKMKGEEVVLKLDPVLGKVVRIEFDGKIEGEAGDTSVQFMAIASRVTRDDEEDVYSIKLENENGVESYIFADEAEAFANEQWVEGSLDIRYTFARVTFNDDGEITKIETVAENVEGKGSFTTANVSNEDYEAMIIDNAEYDEDNKRIRDSKDIADEATRIRVNDNVVVVRIVYDSEEKETSIEVIDEALAEIEELDGKESVLVIYEIDDEAVLPTARYVVITDEATNTSDNLVGIVNSIKPNKIDSDKLDLELETEDGTLEIVYDDETVLSGDDFIYDLLVFKTKTNSKDETVAKYVTGLKDYELNTATETHGYVSEVDDSRTFKAKEIGSQNAAKWYELDTKEVKDIFDECMFVLVSVSQEEGTQYEVDGFEVLDYDEVSVEKFDRISIRDLSADGSEVTGCEVVFIIRGMGEIE